MTIDLQEQSCTQKETTLLCENTATPKNDKKSDKPNKNLSKKNNNGSRKISSKNEIKDKKFRKSKNITVILGDSIIKDMKGLELIDKLHKAVVKSFCGATTSQMKWHVKLSTEQSLKYNFTFRY